MVRGWVSDSADTHAVVVGDVDVTGVFAATPSGKDNSVGGLQLRIEEGQDIVAPDVGCGGTKSPVAVVMSVAEGGIHL